VREIRVPGDKSLSHRALMLAALADGESRISGILPGADPLSTAAAFRALGRSMPSLPPDGAQVRIHGQGLTGLTSPASPLDLGNSGTTARLLLGVLAGQPGLRAELTGDSSLHSRPMRRVSEPLVLMGARIDELGESDRLPLRITGGPLRFLDYPSPVASAQVKSALLLAGLTGGVPVQITEPRRSRDHTERLLTGLGATVISHAVAEGWRVELRDPPGRIAPLDFVVPGDISSGAFLVALALMGGAGDGIVIRDVGLNPTRTGLLAILERMGARIAVEGAETDSSGTEPMGTLIVRPSELRATEVTASEIPALVDEIPILAALAATAQGTTRIRGAAELRLKESDRLAVLARNLRTLGVDVEEYPDGLDIQGREEPLAGSVPTHHDHRIAMAFGVLGALKGNRIQVQDPDIADISFPGFWSTLKSVSAESPTP